MRRLLYLYPRAWRERYGEEFLATIAASAPGMSLVIDIVSGAIDARFSPDIRRAGLTGRAVSNGGHPTMLKSLMACGTKEARTSTRDSLIGAGILLAATAFFAMVTDAVRRAGWPAESRVIQDLAFPAALALSMPFWLMKGAPRTAQWTIVGGTLLILAAIGYFNIAW